MAVSFRPLLQRDGGFLDTPAVHEPLRVFLGWGGLLPYGKRAFRFPCEKAGFGEKIYPQDSNRHGKRPVKTKSLFFTVFWAGLLLFGIIFHASLYNYLWGVSWNRVLSMGVFVAGSIYAIIERNFIVGVVSIVAALILPWIYTWLAAYWPWFKANYGFFNFH